MSEKLLCVFWSHDFPYTHNNGTVRFWYQLDPLSVLFHFRKPLSWSRRPQRLTMQKTTNKHCSCMNTPSITFYMHSNVRLTFLSLSLSLSLSPLSLPASLLCINEAVHKIPPFMMIHLHLTWFRLFVCTNLSLTPSLRLYLQIRSTGSVPKIAWGRRSPST